MEHQDIIHQLRPLLAEVKGIDAAVLYGSLARGEATPNSDIDLALFVNDRFDRDALMNALKSMSPAPDHVMVVAMRNKLVAFFHGMRIKLEMPIHHDPTSFGRDLSGSAIPDHLLPEAVLFDHTGSMLDILCGLQRTGYVPVIVEDLVQKFIYEFDNMSTFHRRSDGYRALYFHQIALHCLVQLINMSVGGDRFQFLPRNILVNITGAELRKRLYALNGSMYLPDINGKKRALLDLMYETLDALGYADLENVRQLLERIYRRDQYWNLRTVDTHGPCVGWPNLVRSSLPAIMDQEALQDVLKQHDIHTIIDLRAPRELAEHPYPTAVLADIHYVHASFDPWAQPDWFKAPEYQQGEHQEIAYRFFALGCRESIRELAQALTAVPRGRGAVIHCHAGKDRTGIVCTLLHLLVGAELNEVLTDYLASESDTYAHNLQIVLDIIESEGGIRAYLRNCDLTDAAINDLEKRLAHA